MVKKYIGISLVALCLGLTSCDDFLDKLPDNRTEANTEERSSSYLYLHIPHMTTWHLRSMHQTT